MSADRDWQHGSKENPQHCTIFDIPCRKSQTAVMMCSVYTVCCNMAQQMPLLTLATFSVGVGLRSVNRKLHSLCAAQLRVCCLTFCLPALPAAETIAPPELNGFQLVTSSLYSRLQELNVLTFCALIVHIEHCRDCSQTRLLHLFCLNFFFLNFETNLQAENH